MRGEREHDEHRRDRERCRRLGLEEANGAREHAESEQRDDGLGSDRHSPGHRADAERTDERPDRNPRQGGPTQAVSEEPPAQQPRRGEADERREPEHQECVRAVHEPVLSPLEPEVEREIHPERGVVGGEPSRRREVALPCDDPAVVEERGPDQPPAEQDDGDDDVREETHPDRLFGGGGGDGTLPGATSESRDEDQCGQRPEGGQDPQGRLGEAGVAAVDDGRDLHLGRGLGMQVNAAEQADDSRHRVEGASQ